ncbi:serine hydrolase domain-containing protein [Qipengyuania spongiae]|uniref:Beta-lactamase family protein n=1 Tax=Qipengyuania spongiae TaxID=2909673 RepID=A0ABY5SYX0_9SPHN|nr:serine hydrolase domain-containing protein [Qipengyuania spongiae]UVI38394.1 beta-lactamase family protein [Qipengyuania spongiae]
MSRAPFDHALFARNPIRRKRSMLIACSIACMATPPLEAFFPASQSVQPALLQPSDDEREGRVSKQPQREEVAGIPACETHHFPPTEAVDALVRPFIDSGQAKGIVIGLLEPDGSRRILTYGQAGEGAAPLTTSSVFEIGSITKTFTGAVFADMVRKGEVDLDAPLSRYLPAGVRAPVFGDREITLLDLATHSSGLPRLPTGYVSPDPANPYAEYSAEDLYAFLNSYELDREPGSKLEYSNLGMGLLGYALARAAGANNFKELVMDRVVRPLGMSMTAYGRPDTLSPWMTKGHNKDGAVASYFDVDVLAGGGGLNSNVHDLLSYLDANIGEATSPLEASLREAHRAHRPGPKPGITIGLAWMTIERDNRTMLGHNGGTAGYSTYIAFDPVTRAGIVVLSNSGDFDYADRIGRDLLQPTRTDLSR